MSQESIISYFWRLNILLSLNLNLFGGHAKGVFPIPITEAANNRAGVCYVLSSPPSPAKRYI